MSDTIHQIVTERMIAALQRGTIPWRKPWHPATGQPRSMSTGQPYRGVNLFLLSLTAGEKGYASPYWATYQQTAALGGQVRKGERSTLVVFWKKAKTEHRDPQTGEVTIRAVPVLRYYRVFNAHQAEGLPGRFYPPPGEHQSIAEPQAALDGYLARGPQLVHVAGDRADYRLATDTIRLPLPAQFRSPEGYYAAAFHEAGHSTGHPHRLNRAGIAAFDHFGSGKYAREELVAEMTSAILCACSGIDNPDLFDNSAAYMANWLTALGGDPKLVITAAAHAQHATDLITQPEREPAKTGVRRQDPAPATDAHAPVQATAAPALRAAAHDPGQAAATSFRPTLTGSPHVPAGPDPSPPSQSPSVAREPAHSVSPGHATAPTHIPPSKQRTGWGSRKRAGGRDLPHRSATGSPNPAERGSTS
jgi:antirestriction protein ArdC